jgi:hypothetical protein
MGWVSYTLGHHLTIAILESRCIKTELLMANADDEAAAQA